MGAFIVKQPNGLYCRFSSVVDCPTNWNMTEEDYIELCAERAREEAREILKRHLYPFEMLREYFHPSNMTETEFEECLTDMSNPVEEKDTELTYDYSDAVDYISARCSIPDLDIEQVLELELEYMKSIGIAYDLEEE